MCNLYGSTKEASIHKYWRPNNAMPSEWDGGLVVPRKPGAFVRRVRDDAAYSRELVVGRWGLIPWFSKTADIKYSTNNATNVRDQSGTVTKPSNVSGTDVGMQTGHSLGFIPPYLSVPP